ncbi:DNA-binding protein [Clostridium botulinum]|uniref:DNA-binding protein n=1 Tax=Clostridium botulinum TaxID=1491 RepID=A0A846J5I1_CLOBO|nr:DNA-binding protein [Clostridium botulinum]ACA54194.1 putative membrane protein [Clostridium botulinum A3 str. Loch Maree]KEJ00040.1 DNA-binding protein [Clostridium botulinum A2B7 92]NFJ07123.1 DNA-binding protein [Clostridium botulinum]NFK14095.1 DNA-binding protein [Clostridium botulinum]NFM92249.1 DNA-binding protein [Clostridium botulinum]
MLKLEAWILWLIGAICFIIAGIMKIIKKEYFSGISFIILGGTYITFSIINHKGINKIRKNTLSDEELKNMDNELRELITEGERIKAIKKYRIVTGAGLIEAKEYVDSLSK